MFLINAVLLTLGVGIIHEMKLLVIVAVVLNLPVGILQGEVVVPDGKEAKLVALAKKSPKRHLGNLLEYNLEKLDAVYATALQGADDRGHREALKTSQKAWIKFFEADGVVASWNAKGGSSAYPAAMQQKIYQVRSRIYQLSTPFLQGWPNVPVVPYPSNKDEEKKGGR